MSEFKILHEVVQCPDGKIVATMEEAEAYWNSERRKMAAQEVLDQLNRSLRTTLLTSGQYTRPRLDLNDVLLALYAGGFNTVSPDWKPREGKSYDSSTWTGRDDL